MATLKEISKLTGVSATTISRVLNRDETISVSPETSRSIFDAAYSLGYRSPRKRKQLEKTTLIGVADWRVLPDSTQNACIRSLRYYADMESSNCSLDFVPLKKNEVRKTEGIIAFGELSDDELDLLKQSSPYILLVNGEKFSDQFDQIYVDLNSSWERAMKYLIQDCGRTNVGYIGGKYDGDGYSIGYRRKDKLVSLLEQHGIYDPSCILVEDFSEEAGFRMVERLISQKSGIDALIIGSDRIAVGAIRALSDKGVRIPADIELVIYQDVHTAQLPAVDCAVLMAYPNILWQKAIQMILERIRGRVEIVTTVIYPQIHIIAH